MNKVKVSVVRMVALSSILIASDVNALGDIYPYECVNGANNKANIILNQNTLAATMNGTNVAPQYTNDVDGQRYIYLNNFYTDSQFTYPGTPPLGEVSTYYCDTTLFPVGSVHHPLTMLCNTTPTNSSGINNNSPYNKELPAVCSYTGSPNYQVQNKLTRILYAYGTTKVFIGTVIGLAGAYKVRSDMSPYPELSARWGNLSLQKTSVGWLVKSENAILFELVGGSDVVTGTGAARKVTITGNLKFGNAVATAATPTWGKFFSDVNLLGMTVAERNLIIGSISVSVNF
ncbi:MAG: hypothetical protein HOP02_09790 [Methylococcaceae bacterium]|nr:hypothetical protein [Methylococcaceae bacterium]